MPAASSLALTSARAIVFIIATLIFATTGSGVLIGTNSPSQFTALKPGKKSPTGARLGKKFMRSGLVTAIPFSRPSAIIGIKGEISITMPSTWPATVSVTAGPAPLYGT